MAGLRVSVVKPVKPLRYRLSPVEEKLDNLDKLEKEFEQAVKAGKIPEEQRIEYSLYIKVQRDKLQTAKDKAQGIKPTSIEKDYDAMPYSQDAKVVPELTQKQFQWILFFCVIFWLYLKNNG